MDVIWNFGDVSKCIPGNHNGNMKTRVNNVVAFTKDDSMELNTRKCKEMKIYLRKKVTALLPIRIGDNTVEEVTT